MTTQDTRFYAYSPFGGYPMLYLLGKECTVLCADCAREEHEEEGTNPRPQINWHRHDHCEGCGELIKGYEQSLEEDP